MLRPRPSQTSSIELEKLLHEKENLACNSQAHADTNSSLTQQSFTPCRPHDRQHVISERETPSGFRVQPKEPTLTPLSQLSSIHPARDTHMPRRQAGDGITASYENVHQPYSMQERSALVGDNESIFTNTQVLTMVGHNGHNFSQPDPLSLPHHRDVSDASLSCSHQQHSEHIQPTTQPEIQRSGSGHSSMEVPQTRTNSSQKDPILFEISAIETQMHHFLRLKQQYNADKAALKDVERRLQELENDRSKLEESASDLRKSVQWYVNTKGTRVAAIKQLVGRISELTVSFARAT